MATKDKDPKYEFSFDGVTAGEAYRSYRRKLLVEGAGITDESGCSLADYLLGVDMGGAAGPPIPAGAPGAKMVRLRSSRAKKACKLILDTQASQDIVFVFSDAVPAGGGAPVYFQNGLACLNYLDAGFDTALTQSEIDDQDDEWRAIDILRGVGIHESSITQIVALIARVNAMRPVAVRFSQTQLCEKLLQMIYKCSSHFHQSECCDRVVRHESAQSPCIIMHCCIVR